MMPTAFVKKLGPGGEAAWNRAKEIVSKEYGPSRGDSYWARVASITKKIAKGSTRGVKETLDESIEDAARDLLNFGSHEGPCVHDMPNGACSRHWAAMAKREEALRRELGEDVLPGSPQAVRKTRPKRRKMYHPHLKRGYRSEWHHKAPGVQHDRQHAPNANGPWMHRHYGSHGEVVGSWHAPGVHETVTSGSVGTGPATALGATTPAPAVNPAATQAPHAPPLASVRPNWSQANKQRFAPRGNKRQARVVYRGYSPKV